MAASFGTVILPEQSLPVKGLAALLVLFGAVQPLKIAIAMQL